MFAKFFITAFAILVAGPIHNEGGVTAIQEKGLKDAAKQAVAEREELTADWYEVHVND